MTIPADQIHAPAPRGNFDLIVALFCSFLLISNVAAGELIQFGSLTRHAD